MSVCAVRMMGKYKREKLQESAMFWAIFVRRSIRASGVVVLPSRLLLALPPPTTLI